MDNLVLKDILNLYYPLSGLDEQKKLAENRAIQKFVEMRWGNECMSCPYYGSNEQIIESVNKGQYMCKNNKCFKIYTIKTGTILENSNLNVGFWLCLIWILSNKDINMKSRDISKLFIISLNSLYKIIKKIKNSNQTLLT